MQAPFAVFLFFCCLMQLECWGLEYYLWIIAWFYTVKLVYQCYLSYKMNIRISFSYNLHLYCWDFSLCLKMHIIQLFLIASTLFCCLKEANEFSDIILAYWSQEEKWFSNQLLPCKITILSPDGKYLLFISAKSAVDSGAHGATNSLHKIDWPVDGELSLHRSIVDVVSYHLPLVLSFFVCWRSMYLFFGECLLTVVLFPLPPLFARGIDKPDIVREMILSCYYFSVINSTC